MLRKSGGIVYSQSCVTIPEDLKNKAKEAGINISRTLTDALKAKLEESQEPLKVKP